MSADPEKQLPTATEPQTALKGAEADPEQSLRSSLEQPAQTEAPKAVNPWADPSSFPDGGAQAWLTVAAASACFFVSWGLVFLISRLSCCRNGANFWRSRWINCIGVFQDYYMRAE